MGDDLSEEDGSISPNQAAYFEARARGGAALLLVGSVSIGYPRGSFGPRQVAASDDRYLPGLAELADRVHRHGARIGAQLVHDGQMSLLDVARGEPMLVPSVPKPGSPDRYYGMVTPAEAGAMTWAYTQPTSKVEYHVATEADLAVGRRAVRRRRGSVPPGGIRRHRAARGPRVLDRRVPHAVDELAHRWVGRQRGEPRPPSARGDPRVAGATRRRRPALDPHQRSRAPQDRRRSVRRAAPGDQAGGRGRNRRGPPHRLRQHRRRHRRDGRLRTAHLRGRAPGLAHGIRGGRARGRRRSRHHVRSDGARRSRSGARGGQGRFRGDGAQAARRSRPAQQARGGASRRHPPVHLPVPLHRQHLRERVIALHRQRTDWARARPRRRAQREPAPCARRRRRRGWSRNRARARGEWASGDALGRERGARWRAALRRARRPVARALPSLAHRPSRAGRE